MKNIFRPFVKSSKGKTDFFDSTNRIAKILYAFSAYRRIFFQAVDKEVPLLDLIRTQYPFWLPDARVPPFLTVEFTNHCNLRCLYCVRPNEGWPRGLMDTGTFSKLIDNLSSLRINRVRVVGNGEPTLHPDFPYFVQELARVVKYLSVLSNGQWTNQAIPSAMLKAPVDLIEISVDAGGREVYEKSKVNGVFNTLMNNLQELKRKKEELKASSLINIRLYFRPSQRAIENEQLVYWHTYADTVMRQYLIKMENFDYDKDLYVPTQQVRQLYPRCNLLFKCLILHWNGDVPLCNDALNRVDPKQLVIGNIKDHSLKELWEHPLKRQYRQGHRYGNFEKIPICKGCRGY